jgi:hypothetical protein
MIAMANRDQFILDAIKFEQYMQLVNQRNYLVGHRGHYSFMMQTMESHPVNAATNFEHAVYVFLWNWCNWKLARTRLAMANMADRDNRGRAMRELNLASRMMRETYTELRQAKAELRRSRFRIVTKSA